MTANEGPHEKILLPILPLMLSFAKTWKPCLLKYDQGNYLIIIQFREQREQQVSSQVCMWKLGNVSRAHIHPAPGPTDMAGTPGFR